ncbi:MAG: class I SAM-dependent methyltransferase [Acidobacteriota bacterium]
MSIAERFQGANVIDAGRLSPYWGEHVARYMFATQFGSSKSVLDIACGTGYGLSLLGAAAKSVVGVDISFEAAIAAKGECQNEALILLGDGKRLPFADRSFDLVTSFETLEHLKDRSDFLAELCRVIIPGGKLVLSTPNAVYTMPQNGVPSNPFHIFEYTPQELRAELSAHFRIDRFLGQSLDVKFQIPPFFEAQQRLPNNVGIRTRLIAWKLLNRMPSRFREWCSRAIWGAPFYPTESDYNFSETTLDRAPVIVAVCEKEDYVQSGQCDHS